MTAAATKYWKPMPKFRIVRAYGFYSVGDIIEPTGMQRDALLNGGFIEPVKANQETAAAPETRDAGAPQPKKRGRPRSDHKDDHAG